MAGLMDREDIEAAQASWGAAVVHVGAAESWEEAHARAVQLVEDHYCLEGDDLLFCPTKAAERPFRQTLEDAVSYFVGRDPGHPEDGGFALEPWVGVRFANAGVVCRQDVGITMGHYVFCRGDGSELLAEYSLVYVRDHQGALKLQLHHSALPYSG